MIRNAVLIPKTCRSIHFWHPMSQRTLIYMFLESAPDFWSFKPNLNKIWERSRTNIFFIQGSPLLILMGIKHVNKVNVITPPYLEQIMYYTSFKLLVLGDFQSIALENWFVHVSLRDFQYFKIGWFIHNVCTCLLKDKLMLQI